MVEETLCSKYLRRSDLDCLLKIIQKTMCCLGIIGVISFTFNLTKQRTVIRVRPEVGAATIAQALSRAGFPSPQQVVKNPKGQEEYISFECSRSVNSFSF